MHRELWVVEMMLKEQVQLTRNDVMYHLEHQHVHSPHFIIFSQLLRVDCVPPLLPFDGEPPSPPSQSWRHVTAEEIVE
jgi:hypothetical protein